MKKHPSVYFLITGLTVLLAGMFFGLLAGAQYVLPGLWRDALPFASLRPLHVSLVVFWLLSGASGCIYFILHSEKLLKKKMKKWLYLQFGLLAVVILGSTISYFTGTFGGREYWEFPPFLAVPLVLAWLVFLGVYLKTIFRRVSGWPVYYWMWLTGIVFFIFSLTESYLWLLPYFNDNIVRDMAVQWKSYGAIVGSWNQLIYGVAFYLMVKISGDRQFVTSPKVFFFFFLGLFNLMFNWGHHIYTLPVSPYIKHISYLVSMTELLIFGKILWDWRSSVSGVRRYFYKLPYRFLFAADVWVFLNLGVAILMSVPALNLHTHGTHITVAHAMGTTIGINTMILMAAFYFIAEKLSGPAAGRQLAAKTGFWLSNFSLLIFWVALLGAGLAKAWYQWHRPELPYSILMQHLMPFFILFVVAGLFLVAGLSLAALPLFGRLLTHKKPAAPDELTYLNELTETKNTNEYANEYL